LLFRPWAAGTTEYLAGDLFLPVWGPQTTSEGRLVSTGGSRLWDHTAYEEQMFYFNTVTRLIAYDHDVRGGWWEDDDDHDDHV
jgi:hypothetical protein